MMRCAPTPQLLASQVSTDWETKPMSQGNYASDDAATPDDEVWFVAVSGNDIRQMSVDQLDEALNAGIITAETAVWQDGMEAWSTLGEMAGLDDAEEADASETAGESAAAEAVAATEAGPATQLSPLASDPMEPSITAAAHGQELTTPYQETQGIAPTVAMPAAAASLAPVSGPAAGSFGQSTVPVALNVDEDMPPVRAGRKFRPERWLIAVAAVGAAGVTLYNNDVFSPAADPAAEAAAAAAKAPEAFAAQPYQPGGVNKGSELGTTRPASVESAAEAPIGSATDSEPAKPTPEEQAAATAKKPLRSSLSSTFNKASKKTTKTKRSRSTSRRKATRTSTKKSSSTKSSGSAFDPLNGALP